MKEPITPTPAEWEQYKLAIASKQMSRREVGRRLNRSDGWVRDRLAAEQADSRNMDLAASAGRRLAEARIEVEALPPRARRLAYSLADQLSEIGYNLSRSAVASAKTAARLHEMAAEKVGSINPDEPAENDLRTAAMLTKVGNDAQTASLAFVSAIRQSPEQLRNDVTEDDAKPAGAMRDDEIEAELKALGYVAPGG